MLRYGLIACTLLAGFSLTLERTSTRAEAGGLFGWRSNQHYQYPYGRGGFHYGCNSYQYRWEGQGYGYPFENLNGSRGRPVGGYRNNSLTPVPKTPVSTNPNLPPDPAADNTKYMFHD